MSQLGLCTPTSSKSYHAVSAQHSSMLEKVLAEQAHHRARAYNLSYEQLTELYEISKATTKRLDKIEQIPPRPKSGKRKAPRRAQKVKVLKLNLDSSDTDFEH